MVVVSKELDEMREKQQNEICPNKTSRGQHSFVFNHWCHCEPSCEDNVHRQCEFCGTSEINGELERE